MNSRIELQIESRCLDLRELAGVVDVIIRNKKHNLYLVTKRDLNKETYPGFFEVSSGAIDFGEELEHAAYREVKEETGLDIYNLKYMYKTFGNHMLYFTFVADDTDLFCATWVRIN